MPVDSAATISIENIKRLYPYILLLVYGLFTCGYFIFQDYNDHYRLFARGLFILGLFAVFPGARALSKHPLFKLVVVYLGYLLLSGVWSDPSDWFRLGQKVTLSIYLLSFVGITYYLVNWNNEMFERALRLCVLMAAVSALVSLVAFYREHPFPDSRAAGLGSLTNVNEFSNIYGVFALLAMSYVLRTEHLLYRMLFLVSVGVFVSFSWFGQSRTAFVFVVVALMLQVILVSRERKALYAAFLASMVCALIMVFPELAERALVRGEGLRPLIWEQIWEQARSAPMAGYGIAGKPMVEVGEYRFETAHNAFLQALWHGGLIGLGLFLALFYTAFRHAWIWGRERGEFTIFCMLIFAAGVMMTGIDTLIDRPRDQWMVFWFPLALLISYQSLVRGDSKGDVQTN